jgi:hypothetical protein
MYFIYNAIIAGGNINECYRNAGKRIYERRYPRFQNR